MILWLYGLSGSGKTTLSNLLLQDFPQFVLIDNDKFRKKISNSFEKKSRIYTVNYLREYIKSLPYEYILVNKITPYEVMREQNKIEFNDFYDVYCKCPIDICIQRDIKGLYKAAKDGLIQHMIGISKDKDDIFEEPKNPSLVIDTSLSLDESYNKLKTFVYEIIRK